MVRSSDTPTLSKHSSSRKGEHSQHKLWLEKSEEKRGDNKRKKTENYSTRNISRYGSKSFVFIHNLPPSCTALELQKSFSDVCPPIHVKVIRDRIRRIAKYAFAVFNNGITVRSYHCSLPGLRLCFNVIDEQVALVLEKCNNTMLKNCSLYLERGMPASEESISFLCQKRTQHTGLLAKSIHSFNRSKSVILHFHPHLQFSSTSLCRFFSSILPSSIKIVKILLPTDKKQQYIVELPTVRHAASLSRSWKEVTIPLKVVKRYHCISESSPLHSGGNEVVFLTVSCLSSHVEKVAKTVSSCEHFLNPAPLIITHIHPSVTEQQLFHILKGYGLIRKLRMLDSPACLTTDAVNQRRALVCYKTSEAAKTVKTQLTGKLFFGVPLKISWGIGKSAANELDNGLVDIPPPRIKKKKTSA